MDFLRVLFGEEHFILRKYDVLNGRTMGRFHSSIFACFLIASFLLSGMAPVLAGIGEAVLPGAPLSAEIHNACAAAGSHEIVVSQESDSKAKTDLFDDCAENGACCIASLASPYIRLAAFDPGKDDLFIEPDDLVFQADPTHPITPLPSDAPTP